MSAPNGGADAAPAGVTLAVDAATYAGTVAVLARGELLAEGEVAMRGEREERLLPAVADALRAAGAGASDVARVVCGAGPGSFTSLRIAASIAKGVATARGLPLYGVSSLWLIAAGARPALAPGEYLAVLDAMRGEWFGAPVRVGDGGAVEQGGGWQLFSAEQLEAWRREGGAAVIGPGPFGGHAPHARGVVRVEAAIARGEVAPLDLDGWEPDYGRKAEAQVRWEATHGRPLSVR